MYSNLINLFLTLRYFILIHLTYTDTLRLIIRHVRDIVTQLSRKQARVEQKHKTELKRAMTESENSDIFFCYNFVSFCCM